MVDPWDNKDYFLEFSNRDIKDIKLRWFCIGFLGGIFCFWALASIIDAVINRWPA